MYAQPMFYNEKKALRFLGAPYDQLGHPTEHLIGFPTADYSRRKFTSIVA